MKNLLLSLLALSLFGCSPEPPAPPKNLLISNDFESMEGWLGPADPPTLTKERAHSGKYSVKVSPDVEFSLGYTNQLSKLSQEKLHKIKIRAWVYVIDTTVHAKIVTELNDPNSTADRPMMWQGFDLAKEAPKTNEWVPIEQVVTLPDDAKHYHRISVYLWRSSSKLPAYLDDLEIYKEE